MKNKKTMPPVHPGEILLKEFLEPMGISMYRLAKSIHVPPIRVSNLVHGKVGVSADTALRLGRFFGTTAEFWVNMQAFYELEAARDRLGSRLEKEIHAYAA